jgi:hypothetical protein
LAAERHSSGEQGQAEMNQAADGAADPHRHAFAIVATPLIVQGGISQPPQCVSGKARGHDRENELASTAVESFESAGAILGSPRLKDEQADQDVHHPAGGEAKPSKHFEFSVIH